MVFPVRVIVWQAISDKSSALFLASSPDHALRIFRQAPSDMPADHDVREHFPAAEEILSIPRLESAAGVDGAGLADAEVLDVVAIEGQDEAEVILL